MPPSPSLAPSLASGSQTPTAQGREPPRCPVCAQRSDEPPDAYAVYRCAGCMIEFRPPRRVPVRHAGVSTSTEVGNGWIGLGVVAAVIIGIAIAVGDSKAPSDPPAFDGVVLDPQIYQPAFDPVILDPVMLDGIVGLLADLEYELHVSSLDGDEVFLTGLVRNADAQPVESVEVEVRCLDAAGAVLEIRQATHACGRLAAGEVCAWGLDARVSGIAGFEIDARAKRRLGVRRHIDLRARYDRDGGRLDDPPAPPVPPVPPVQARAEGQQTGTAGLELDTRRAHFTLAPGVTALELRAVVVSHDAEGRVRAVDETRWPGMVAGGQEQWMPVTIDAGEDVHDYELRVLSSLVIDTAPAGPGPAPAGPGAGPGSGKAP